MGQDREPTTDVVGLTASRTPALMRAGTDDRTRVTDWLQAHSVPGRLNSSELEAGIERALAARTMGDLAALTADLPPMAPPTSPSTHAESRRERRRDRRRHRGRGSKQGFTAHATSYLLLMALLVTI